MHINKAGVFGSHHWISPGNAASYGFQKLLFLPLQKHLICMQMLEFSHINIVMHGDVWTLHHDGNVAELWIAYILFILQWWSYTKQDDFYPGKTLLNCANNTATYSLCHILWLKLNGVVNMSWNYLDELSLGEWN
jgi:hypothetical protein